MNKFKRGICVALCVLSSAAWAQDLGIDVSDPDVDRSFGFEEKTSLDVVSHEDEPATLNRGSTFNRNLLKNVQDNTLGLRYEERDVYYRMLKLAQVTPLGKLESSAAKFRERRWQSSSIASKRKLSEFSSFIDLFENPQKDRGQPVSLHGVLRKLTKYDPGRNAEGITDVYEGWIYPDESQGNPAVIVFSSKPDKLPLTGDMTEEIRVTGYFLKMYGYEAQDVPRKAPLLLAGEVEWRRRSKGYVAESLPLEVYLLTGLVVMMLGYSLWQAGNRSLVGHSRSHSEIDFSTFPQMVHPTTPPPVLRETDDASKRDVRDLAEAQIRPEVL